MVTNQGSRRENDVQNVFFGLLFGAVQVGIFGPPVFRMATLAIEAGRSFFTHTIVAMAH